MGLSPHTNGKPCADDVGARRDRSHLDIHLAAAKAYLDRNKGMAATILQIADAAESEWLRRAKPLPL
jgi:hypothetical protein